MTYDGESWLRRSRFLGAMRYHRAWMGRLIGWACWFAAGGQRGHDLPRRWRARAI